MGEAEVVVRFCRGRRDGIVVSRRVVTEVFGGLV